MKRRIAAACLLVLLAGLSGCGTKKVSVSGTVTQGGEKLTWPDGGILLVVFAPEDRGKNPERYRAETDIATSTYKIDAIPPGKYVVAIQQFDQQFNDRFGKAHDLGRTALTYEVTHDGQVIDIDIPAAEGGTRGGFGGRRGGRKGGDPPAEPEKGKDEPAKPDDKKGEPAKPNVKKD